MKKRKTQPIRRLRLSTQHDTSVCCDVCNSPDYSFVHRQTNGWIVGKCARCNLVQIIPKPTRSAVGALYEHDWEHFSPYISQTQAHREYFQTLLRFVLPLAGTEGKGKRILDVGCATGILLEEAKKNNMTAVGIDVSADAIDHCRKKDLAAIHTTLSDLAKEKIPAFDIITACEVIEHEYDPITMIKSAFSLLKDSGLFIITTPNFNTIYRTLFRDRWVGYQHPEHLWFYTPETISDALHSGGFRDVNVQNDFSRGYELSYAFRRLGDYFPAGKFIFTPFEKLSTVLKLKNPINPWGDMLVIGRKLPSS